jgi:hypothetical protein
MSKRNLEIELICRIHTAAKRILLAEVLWIAANRFPCFVLSLSKIATEREREREIYYDIQV